MSDEQRKSAGETPKDVPIDWEALEDAFENNAPEVHSYLHLKTGEVLRVVDGIADPEMHSRIAADSAYMRIEPVSSREQYRWMERFIQMLDNRGLRDALTAAIDGKGAFRRFKDVLMAYSAERERWFAFRSERLRVFMEAWLSAHALRAVPRPEVAPPSTEEPGLDPPSISQEQISGRRAGRTPDHLRRQLSELAESLGSRDLEKVLTFAEFVKARRVARGYSQRHDHESSPESAQPDAEAAEDNASQESEDPPSSRRLPAAR